MKMIEDEKTSAEADLPKVKLFGANGEEVCEVYEHEYDTIKADHAVFRYPTTLKVQGGPK
jgi:hypothetical protein